MEGTVRSVAKAMELLQLLSDRGAAMSLTEISHLSGLPKSTAFGLLNTMRGWDVVEQDQSGHYTLGLRLFEYGCHVSRSWEIADVARPYMERLASAVGCSAVLSVCEGNHVVTLDQVESRSGLRVVSDVGGRLPLYCTSQGKVFLSALTDTQVLSRLKQPELLPYTPHTVTDPRQLLPQLEQVRQNGYAIENGEYKIGLRSISAPVNGNDGKIRYTVGVIGMFRSIHSDEFESAIGAVVETGKQISAALGYRK